jgi:hypothetical protein
MISAAFEYKCRRCNEVYRDGKECAPEYAEVALVCATGNVKASKFASPNLIHFHDCANGGMGISDLVGFGFKEVADE